MEKLKPNEQRAKNAITLIWIVLILEVLSFISSYLQYDLLLTIANGGEFTEMEASENDIREQIIGVLYLIATVISIVTFILWFRRAYFNLHLKANNLSYSEGWAAGSWFVPIISLYRPYQIMKELYLKTKELFIKNDINYDQNFTTNYLGWWWTIWMISNFFGQFIFRYSLNAETIDELTTSTILAMILNVVGIPLAWITVKIIKDYSKNEQLLKKIID